MSVFTCGLLVAEERKSNTPLVSSAFAQSTEALALDDQLAKEMEGYRARYRDFRNGLRVEYSRGEERVTAVENWEKDHKTWKEDWERRSNNLEKIWNWGAAGKPEIPKQVENTRTANGRVQAAMSRIRLEAKGTGRKGENIEAWLEANKALLAEAEREVDKPPTPSLENLTLRGTDAEIKFSAARRVLSRLRKELVAQGIEVLKTAMNDPQSEYSLKKSAMEEQHRDLELKQKTIKE